MTTDPRDLIDGYLDDGLAPESLAALDNWIQANPSNATRFARAVLLHDRLQNELSAVAADRATLQLPERTSPRGAPRWRLSQHPLALAGLAALVVVSVALWWNVGGSQAMAASAELTRMIAAASTSPGRTYRLAIEDVATGRPAERRVNSAEAGRPPKQPLDNATLYVGGGRRFVLVRRTPDGRPFVTGSDGRTSWAVRPDGPVLVSPDPSHFARDVPGHEHGMSLIDVTQTLDQLRNAYNVSVLPVESAPPGDARAPELTRLLVGVKKPGNRGPRRVEVTYLAATGRIAQVRFVDMPYGPDRVTVRLTLVEERDPGAAFYDHPAHHAAERAIEQEVGP